MCGCSDIEEASYIPLDGYNRSKVANVLVGIAANNRLFDKYGILALAVHPGVIETELGRNMSAEDQKTFAELRKGVFKPRSLGAGASTSLVAALDPKLAQCLRKRKADSENWGSYLDNCQISDRAHPLAVSTTEAEKLWEVSEKPVMYCMYPWKFDKTFLKFAPTIDPSLLSEYSHLRSNNLTFHAPRRPNTTKCQEPKTEVSLNLARVIEESMESQR
ncbi:uncharacterized protein LDX57_000163 [Aspergillus melleus]|uniref:uncharacterized protein n=1 Tax=Aspergillus melleus TaxID=138277 RepID=UPI001E8EC7E6|nr:uncharacterized protein LDX57_000163 [Aspergillus melleus]KAH8422409.1 hypothetical protein LDX57_000163 [Aspergillus melleus]